MTDFIADQPAVQCFLSFTHADDGLLNFVTPLKASIEQFCAAAHGRKIEIFVDRESIGWGEDWRAKIQDGLDAAMVLIPAVTMNYFYNSSACREELTAFYAKANELGLTQLILPLIILGRDLITENSDDANVRIIEKLQHIDIEEAVLAGSGTTAWRRTMAAVAKKLIKAIQSAENQLERLSEPEPARTGDGGLPGFQEHRNRLEQVARLLGQQLDTITVSLGGITAEMNQAAADIDVTSPDAAKERIARTADTIKPLSVSMQKAGTDFEATVAETDTIMRSYLAFVASHGSPEMAAQARKEQEAFVPALDELQTMEKTIAEYLRSAYALEKRSAPLRAALQPLRIGAQSIQLGIRTLQDLQDL
ncbi:toll/interleukin-1 receptor domain-containing protein [Amycolatopsis sp. FBCC-B4732]|uniref:toll/interleukin-1 receptor domain-containing protein n=1 Tax=Amycolatopsis sp. FBCC-B4732 TaxID=3079339 RepID=UPI001FF4C388|nr:toll/interleukin-1 receptor domain-containing protein [Amycolatopsis sp. FBCC-B4732]UOX84719.1 toll/interleukin-1 receptor domain-containing protein [Amycolatopsis sp. FBCC-B4732]